MSPKTSKSTRPRAARKAAPKKARPVQVASATYVYCVVRAKRAPALGEIAALPEMGAPRALDAGRGVFVIVSDAPLSAYGEETVNDKLKDMDWVSQCALAHEGVIEAARRADSVVPMKLFTLFHDDARALAFVQQDRARLDRVLERLAGCSEFGVRLTLDERRARKSAEARAVKSAGGASGAAFLLRKKNLKEAAEEVSRSAREVANDVFDALTAAARDSLRRSEVEGLVTGSRLLMDGVFLVPNTAEPKFRAALEQASRALSDRGYDLALNGPWPAYHFVAGAA